MGDKALLTVVRTVITVISRQLVAAIRQQTSIYPAAGFIYLPGNPDQPAGKWSYPPPQSPFDRNLTVFMLWKEEKTGLNRKRNLSVFGEK
nr:hypothetical protein [Parabacteroides goldsteinii]